MTEPKAVRRCSICEHPSVAAINQAILNNKSYRAVARDFQIGSGQGADFKPDHKKVIRHAEGCMATSFQALQETGLTAQGAAIHARMKFLDEQVDQAIEDALLGDPIMVGDTPMLDDDGKPMRTRSVSHIRALLAAVREGRQNQALVAKLSGAVPEEDADALEAARKGLESPTARRLLQQLEEELARQAEAQQGG